MTRYEQELERRKNRIAKVIRKHRQQKGLSVERAAKFLFGPAADRTKARTWFRWEAGERMPPFPQVVEVCDIIGAPIEDLMEAVRPKGYA